jgi:hypothetical protein
MFHRWLFTILSLTCCTTAIADTLVGTVKDVDADKKPVAKADVALFWDVVNGAMTPHADKATVTDGTAVRRVDDWTEKRPLLVLSADRTFGASKADNGKEVGCNRNPPTPSPPKAVGG